MRRIPKIGGVVAAMTMLAGTVQAAEPEPEPVEDDTSAPKVDPAVTRDAALGQAKSRIGEAKYEDANTALAALASERSSLSDEQRQGLAVLVNELRFAYGTERERALEKLHAEAIAKRLGCTDAKTLCVRGDGSPFGGDTLGTWVDGGDTILVRVVGCRETYGTAAFEVTADATARNERLFREALAQEAERASAVEAAPAPESLNFCTKPDDMVAIHQGKVEVPDDTTKDGLRVTVTRKGTEDGAIPEASAMYTTRIEHGRYFLDLGVMVPVVFGGDQTVVAVPLEQSPTDFALTERTDLLVAPAVVINVFPGGRERGKIGSFTGYTCPAPVDKTCRKHGHRRRTANSLGLQIGVDVDLSTFDRMFFGPMFEPVSGLSIGAGVAAVKAQRLTEGISPGRIVDPDELDTFTRSRFVARPYVSVTFSLDIIRNLAGFRGRSSSK